MVNTLRRKMFKMGGNVPKAHGVGITSNLKMKKGGRVEPQATFGVGNNAVKFFIKLSSMIIAPLLLLDELNATISTFVLVNKY